MMCKKILAISLLYMVFITPLPVWADKDAGEPTPPIVQKGLDILNQSDVDPQVRCPAAIAVFKKASAEGYRQAEIILAQMFMYPGGCFEPDPVQAVFWLKRAEKRGSLTAAASLGDIYIDGLGALKPDYAKALYWYEKPAQSGLAYAQYQKGRILYNGLAERKDTIEGLRWIAVAAQRGSIAAKEMLDSIAADPSHDHDISAAHQWAAEWKPTLPEVKTCADCAEKSKEFLRHAPPIAPDPPS